MLSHGHRTQCGAQPGKVPWGSGGWKETCNCLEGLPHSKASGLWGTTVPDQPKP